MQYPYEKLKWPTGLQAASSLKDSVYLGLVFLEVFPSYSKNISKNVDNGSPQEIHKSFFKFFDNFCVSEATQTIFKGRSIEKCCKFVININERPGFIEGCTNNGSRSVRFLSTSIVFGEKLIFKKRTNEAKHHCSPLTRSFV